MTLIVSGLVTCACLLAWPAERLHRLSRLGLRPADSTAGVLASLRSLADSAKARQESAQRTIDALVSLEAELRSGRSPSSALRAAAGLPPVWPTALAALSLGGDVGQALRADAREQPMLAQLAACWEVAAHSGSGLAQAVAVLAHSCRAGEEVRASLNAELAAPRATARVLTCLPALGLLLGMSMGSDPVGWLAGSAIGLMCAAAGVGLMVAGWLWSRRIVRAVEREL